MPKVQQKLTQKFERWHKTWIKYNPEWEYKLWTDADNLKLVETDYAWFLETYNGFDRNIERADAVRYMYMHKLGGVYADLDVECLKPMDELTSCGGLIMPLMSDEYGFEHNVPNAWLASSPGHPFWIDMLKSIQASSKGGDAGSVESITGPVRLYHSLARYRQLPGEHAPIIYAKEGLIFPFDWHRSVKFAEFCSAQLDSFDDAACKAEIALVYPNAYSITYWSHSWGDDHSLANLDVEGSH